jgi:hypothetical protein
LPFIDSSRFFPIVADQNFGAPCTSPLVVVGFGAAGRGALGGGRGALAEGAALATVADGIAVALGVAVALGTTLATLATLGVTVAIGAGSASPAISVSPRSERAKSTPTSAVATAITTPSASIVRGSRHGETGSPAATSGPEGGDCAASSVGSTGGTPRLRALTSVSLSAADGSTTTTTLSAISTGRAAAGCNVVGGTYAVSPGGASSFRR